MTTMTPLTPPSSQPESPTRQHALLTSDRPLSPLSAPDESARRAYSQQLFMHTKNQWEEIRSSIERRGSTTSTSSLNSTDSKTDAQRDEDELARGVSIAQAEAPAVA